MDIKKYLDEFKNKRNFTEILPFLNEDKVFRENLLKIIEDKSSYPYSEYASWIWIHLAKGNLKLVQKYYNRLVDILFNTSNQSVLRNTLATLNHIEIESYKESELIELLFGFLENKKNKVALHVHSIYLLEKFIKKYPELSNELVLYVNLLSENASPALTVAIRKFKNK